MRNSPSEVTNSYPFLQKFYPEVAEKLRMSLMAADVMAIAKWAWEVIMNVYNDPNFLENAQVVTKSDNSPFTIADTLSNEFIIKHLQQLTPWVPILSEESKHLPFDQRKDFETYRCIDPLDWTKEFINRTGDFCVNVALMHKWEPVISTIYKPEDNTSYLAMKWLWAYKTNHDWLSTLLKVKQRDPSNVILWISKSRRNKQSIQDFSTYLSKKWITAELRPAWAATKYCLLAEGEIDMYPCFWPTSERDSAAGQLLVQEAWWYFTWIMLEDWEYLPTEFRYNKENLLNGWCLASNSPHYEILN